jgi:hypothetical protein
LAQNAGHVATWSGIARNQAQAHRIIEDRADDRYRCGRLSCRKRSRWIDGDDEVGLQSYQLLGERRQARNVRLSVTGDNVNRLSVCIANLAQPAQEGG